MSYESPEAIAKRMKRHRGSHEDFLGQHRQSVRLALKAGPLEIKHLVADLLPRISDFRMLRCAWEHQVKFGGLAPGIDGETYKDYKPPNEKALWAELSNLSDALKTLQYEPRPLREVKIPKSSGKGYRTLRLPSIWDRVVQRAILAAIQPIVDPKFDRRSYGWRPGRSTRHAFDEARYLIFTKKRQVWVTEDIRDCYEHIPRKRLLDALRRQLPNDDLVTLIQSVIGMDKKRGLPQGGPLMPFLVNVYLDHFLDRVWRKRFPKIPLLRFGDDIALLCLSEVEARQAQAELRAILLSAGLMLKGPPELAVRNLGAGDAAAWLGFLVQCHAKQLRLGIAEQGWGRLREKLENAIVEGDSADRVCNIIEGWITYAVDCGVHVDIAEAADIVIDTLYEVGLERLAHRNAIRGLWRREYDRWDEVRAAAEKQALVYSLADA